MTLRILHVAEDALSAAVSRDLLDRVVAERGPDWLRELFADPALRATQRRFEGLDGAEGWASRGAVKAHAEARGVRSLRRLSGNAALASKCLLLAAKVDPACLVLLAFDRDRHPDDETLRHGVAATTTPAAPRCLVAEAVPEFDAWVLAGWRAESRAEEAALRDAEARIEAQSGKLSPLDALHRLTSNVAGDARDAKRLCAALCGLGAADQVGPEHDRARRCWAEPPLDELEARGEHIGLRVYLHDVDREVVPLLGGAPATRG
ncbi:MAG: hypothetical protein U0324_31225 [Polyangiales bacterium]